MWLCSLKQWVSKCGAGDAGGWRGQGTYLEFLQDLLNQNLCCGALDWHFELIPYVEKCCFKRRKLSVASSVGAFWVEASGSLPVKCLWTRAKWFLAVPSRVPSVHGSPHLAPWWAVALSSRVWEGRRCALGPVMGTCFPLLFTNETTEAKERNRTDWRPLRAELRLEPGIAVPASYSQAMQWGLCKGLGSSRTPPHPFPQLSAQEADLLSPQLEHPSLCVLAGFGRQKEAYGWLWLAWGHPSVWRREEPIQPSQFARTEGFPRTWDFQC